jgi:hypothetical protein
VSSWRSILELRGRIIRLVLYIYILIGRISFLVWPLDWLTVRRLLLLVGSESALRSEGVLLSKVLLSHLSLLLLVSIILFIISLAVLHVHPILVLRHE